MHFSNFSVAHEDLISETFRLDDDAFALPRALDDRLQKLRLNSPLGDLLVFAKMLTCSVLLPLAFLSAKR